MDFFPPQVSSNKRKQTFNTETMVKNFFALLALLMIAGSAFAQTPGNMRVLGDRNPIDLRTLVSCGYDAGTITVLNSQGDTLNDPVIYLPFGESLDVRANGDARLDGDPDTSTDAGITYFFYDCPPTRDSLSIVDLSGDPCRFQADTFFFPDGSTLARQDSFWLVSSGDPAGNLPIVNDSSLQIGFNQGAPVQFWYAPATIDDFAGSTQEAGATCVSVSSAEAFSVVYLNEIKADSIQMDLDGASCSGSFQLTGGLPEFDSTAAYTLTITNIADPSQVGDVLTQGQILSGRTIGFFVPIAGDYEVQVTDDAGSSHTFTLNMGSCDVVVFSLPLQNQMPNDMICVPVTVENFREIGSVSYNFSWDPSVLRLDNVTDLNTALPNFTLASSFGTSNTDMGELIMAWVDLGLSNVSLMDSDTLFNLCFTVVGNFGDFSPIQFVTNTDADDTVLRNDTASVDPLRVGYLFNSGQINVSSDVLFVDIQGQDVSCNGNNMGPTDDGEISVRLAQGVAPYTLTFTPPSGMPTVVNIPSGGMTEVFSNLSPGDYMVSVEDSNPGTANTFSTTVMIMEPEEFEVRVFPRQEVTCSGFSDGVMEAELTINGFPVADLSDYAFSWNITGGDSQIITSLSSGNYSVTVTDASGCTDTNNNDILNKAPIVIPDSTITIVDASCTGVTDGSVSLRAKGGTTTNMAYIYNWELFGPDSTVTASLPAVSPGVYRLTVTDDNGCILEDSVTVQAAKNLFVDLDQLDNISCNGLGDGSIMVSGRTLPVFSESLPYTFTWTGNGVGAPNNVNETSTVDSLSAGTYTVRMRDDVGCEAVDSFVVMEPAILAVAEDSTRDETCTITMDGFASVAVSGGTGPYSYLWDDPAMQTDSFANNLVADTFMVNVTDANGCIDSLELMINAPLGPQITAFASDSVDCSGDTNGALAVTAINGNGNIINYSWSTGNNGPAATSIINLSPGKYDLTITADDGCIAVDSAFVIDPLPLQLDSIIDVEPLCPGFGNGSLTVFASGGTLPYTYVWDEVPTDDTTLFSLKPGLTAGSYEVTIIDANNCPAILGTATVNDPPNIVVDFIDIVGVDCFDGNCDGEARAVASFSDGSPGGMFDFNWSNGTTADDAADLLATGLCAGENVVSVIDLNGCAQVDTVLIPSPDSISIELVSDDPSCNGILDGSVSVNASGGTPGYTFVWPSANGATDMNVGSLGAGTYQVILTDANGCIKTDSVALVEPAELILSINPAMTNDPSCADSMDGMVGVMVNTADGINALGANPYNWAGGIANSDTAVAGNLIAGDYAVTVTDVEGCMDSLTVTLNQAAPIFFNFQQPADPPCFGEATVFNIDTIFGGAGMNILDYTYTVDNNGLGFTPDQPATIFAGTRVITVEDFNGCTASDTIEIVQPDELSVTFTPEIVEVELGDTLVRLNPIINSMQIDSFVWSPSIYLSAGNVQNPVVVPFDNQQYNLRVRDVNGCIAEGNVFVELNRTRNVFIPNVFSPNGDGRNDELRVYACKGVRQINFARVFDRWGSLLFDRENIGIPDCAGGSVLWDGSINNNDLPSGVYVYVIEVEFVDNVTLVYRGDIAIIR